MPVFLGAAGGKESEKAQVWRRTPRAGKGYVPGLAAAWPFSLGCSPAPVERISTTEEKVAALQVENAALKATVSASFQSQVIADRASKTNFITDNMILQSAYVVDYPEYQDNHQYDYAGEILQYNGLLYEIVTPHLSNAVSYPVETTFAYYRLVELTHAGTIDDPIPYPEETGIAVNVQEGQYYAYKGKVYLAKADMPDCIYPPGTPSMWQWEVQE